MNLALFDFDGTISSRDSFLLFLWHANKVKVAQTCLSYAPQIILYKLGHYSNQKLKETFLQKLFAEISLDELETASEQYCNDILPTIIRSGFWQRLAWHRQKGDEVVVVSASPEFMLEPWCRSHGIELIGTEVETDNLGRLTGKLVGKNCMGHEKVRRVKACYDIENYDQLFTYGDTKSDLPMLELAAPENRFYKPFR
jgi:phosphatidylglycerophosphatase C